MRHCVVIVMVDSVRERGGVGRCMVARVLMWRVRVKDAECAGVEETEEWELVGRC